MLSEITPKLTPFFINTLKYEKIDDRRANWMRHTIKPALQRITLLAHTFKQNFKNDVFVKIMSDITAKAKQ